MIASSVEEQEAWSEAFKRARTFNEKARGLITQWLTSYDEVSAKFVGNTKSVTTTSPMNAEFCRSIEGAAVLFLPLPSLLFCKPLLSLHIA